MACHREGADRSLPQPTPPPPTSLLSQSVILPPVHLHLIWTGQADRRLHLGDLQRRGEQQRRPGTRRSGVLAERHAHRCRSRHASGAAPKEPPCSLSLGNTSGWPETCSQALKSHEKQARRYACQSTRSCVGGSGREASIPCVPTRTSLANQRSNGSSDIRYFWGALAGSSPSRQTTA